MSERCWQIRGRTLLDLAVGAAFLGTGGGGDPYIGRLMVQAAIDEGGTVTHPRPRGGARRRARDPDRDDGRADGAGRENPERRGGRRVAAAARVAILGRKAYATMPIEMRRHQLDHPARRRRTSRPAGRRCRRHGSRVSRAADGDVQRARRPGSPMVVTNEYGDSAIIQAHDDKFMEWLSRGVTIRMGGAAYIAEYTHERRGREADLGAATRSRSASASAAACARRRRTTATRSRNCCDCCRRRTTPTAA